MKKYIQPEMEIEEFDVQDIITTSPVGETVMHDVVGNGDDNDFFSN